MSDVYRERCGGCSVMVQGDRIFVGLRIETHYGLTYHREGDLEMWDGEKWVEVN